MEVSWNDNAVYEFLDEFGSIHNSRIDRLCAAAKDRIQFTEIDIDQVLVKNYNNWPKRTEMYERKILRGEQIGTLFCRQKPENKWFIKDGNHRFRAMKKLGITKFRIGYDSENKI